MIYTSAIVRRIDRNSLGVNSKSTVGMSERDSDALKVSTRTALERLSVLTFQQKQLIEAGEFSPVLQQILRKRLPLTAVISAFALLFAYFAVRSVTKSDLSWPSMGAVAGLCWWLYSRFSRERAAVKSVGRYAETSSSVGISASPLATELRLNHRLSFDQHQLLKHGKPVEVATEIAAERRRNGKTLLLWIEGCVWRSSREPRCPGSAVCGLRIW